MIKKICLCKLSSTKKITLWKSNLKGGEIQKYLYRVKIKAAAFH